MKHILSNVSSKFGAPMGRPETTDPGLKGVKFRLVQLAWVDGDYDTGGAYWGAVKGEHVYHALGHGLELFRRAKSFAEAEALILDGYPKAKFQRGEQDAGDAVYYADFNYIGELHMTLPQAKAMSHSGACDSDVAAGLELPSLASQLAAIDPATLRSELTEFGAWEADALADHSENVSRILWLAAGIIVDNNAGQEPR